MADTRTMIDPHGNRVEVFSNRVQFALGIGWRMAPSQSSPTNPDRPRAGQGELRPRAPLNLDDQRADRWAGSPSNQVSLFGTVLWESADGALKITGGNFSSTMRLAVGDGYTGIRNLGFSGAVPRSFIGSKEHRQWMSDMHRWYNGDDRLDSIDQSEFNLGSGLGDSLGGGGFSGPVYVRPDELQVNEFLKSYVVATTGSIDHPLTELAAAEYMKTHRKNFDNPEQEFDALLSAQTVVRNSAVYKDIHELRPESQDEMQWVTSQQGLLRQLGVSSTDSEKLGIKLARVGAGKAANKAAGERKIFSSSGRIADDQRQRLKDSAGAVMGLL